MNPYELDKFYSKFEKAKENGLYMQFKKEVERRMFNTKLFGRNEFRKLLQICSSVEGNNLSSIKVRFFLHYSHDTMDFIQKRVLPEAEFDDYKSLLYFYAVNNAEIGERFNHHKFF